ncbi:arylsulfatase [Fulvivirgaceae bacterium BMA10]|uniref:Arylsulfatase n=1 Tax=Splendidivirga corallicola TaxID=3051826 RepID=A0ABT8KR48_9BACT|nr:arylsulfatase [Fulvivirgaceae bacterium BMA10]
MMKIKPDFSLITLIFFLFSCGVRETSEQINTKPSPPNIIHIVLDELGYFETSYMNNQYLETPNIDKLAAGGLRFNQLLAGASVCAPTRSVLMTGKHLGHTTVRGNAGNQSLLPNDTTIAMVLKKAGYATGGFGKWGLGDANTEGVPEKHGFDIFYGYYDQRHAHTYFPEYLVRNSQKEYLEGNTNDYYKGRHFAHDLIFEESLKFIKENQDKSFYCYLPFTVPHGLWGIPANNPEWNEYKNQDWGGGMQRRKEDPLIYAAMVKMVDRQIGELIELLEKLKLDENTLVLITGDNGGEYYFANEKYPRGQFDPNGGVFRGEKRDFYEGGLRIPAVVWWPGKIKPGSVSEHLCYFPDIMPTFAELVGVHAPDDIDGLSLVPTLLGEEQAGRTQEKHEYLYWESPNGWVAVRSGNWKIVKRGKIMSPSTRRTMGKPSGEFELYNLAEDLGEKTDLAAEYPEIVERLSKYAEMAHEENIIGQVIPELEHLAFDRQTMPK